MKKAWISNKIINSQLIGWAVDSDNCLIFVKIKVIVGSIVFYLMANQPRSKPRSFPQHINNGFKLTLSNNDLLMIREGDLIIVIDDDSDTVLYRTRLKELVMPGDLENTIDVHDENFNIIKNSPLFSEEWYKDKYCINGKVSAIDHYLNIGWKSLYDPSPLFSSFGYYVLNRDVFKADANPLLHYEKQKRKNKIRSIASPDQVLSDEFYDVNFSELKLIFDSKYFDYRWYLKHFIRYEINSIVGKHFAALHYLYKGWNNHCDPSSFFSTDYYLSINSDVALKKMNPLLHYEKLGKHEGRKISSSLIDVSYELKDYNEKPNVQQYKVDVFLIINEPNIDLINLTLNSISNQTDSDITVYLINVINYDYLQEKYEDCIVLDNFKSINKIITNDQCSFFCFIFTGDTILNKYYIPYCISLLIDTETDVSFSLIKDKSEDYLDSHNCVIYNNSICHFDYDSKISLKLTSLFLSAKLANGFNFDFIDNEFDLDLWFSNVIHYLRPKFSINNRLSLNIYNSKKISVYNYMTFDAVGYEKFLLSSLFKDRNQIKRYRLFNKIHGFKHENIFFSVILPTFNRAFCIQNSINSLIRQTYDNYELIIVDDGSTDDTRDILFNNYYELFNKNKFKYYYRHNSGVSSARNFGLSMASGSWICYLDSDNVVSSDYLKSFAYFISKYKFNYFFYAKLIAINSKLEVGKIYNREELLKKNFIDMGVLCHSIKLYKRYGGFDERLKKCVDWDLVLKYTSHTNPIFINNIVLYYNDDQSIPRITNLEKPSINKRIIEFKYHPKQKYNLIDKSNYLIHAYLNKKIKVSIKDPSPYKERLQWGDFWLSCDLKYGLEKCGYFVRIDNREFFNSSLSKYDDVEIVVRGLSFYPPTKNKKSILYIISHPDLISEDEINLYDAIACSSLFYTNILKQRFPNKIIKFIPQFTNHNYFYKDYQSSFSSDLLFVGNTRNIFRDSVRFSIANEFDISVYGKGWEEFIDPKYIKGQYIHNRDLRKYYSSSKIVLNDHHLDMRRYGFVSNRVYDVTSCCGFLVSDYQEDIKTLYQGSIPMFKSETEFSKIVKYFLDDEHKIERDEMALEANKITNKYFLLDKVSSNFDELISLLLN